MKRAMLLLGLAAGLMSLGGCYYSAAYYEGYDCPPPHYHYSHHYHHYDPCY